MFDIDYLFMNYIIYNSLIVVVFVTILVIILLLLLIRYDKFTKHHNLLKLLVFILLTIKADNQWCYLLCIFILALHWNFITENIFEIIERLLLAYHGVNYGNRSEKDKKELDEENEIEFEEINREKKTEFEKENCNNKQENWKKYLRTGLIKLLQAETKCLDALEKQYNLNFERNKKLYKDNYMICPDGIIREKHKDILVEIKYINDYDLNTIKNVVFERFYKYINFYKINLPIQKVDFYFVLYIDSKLSDSEKQAIRKSFEVQFCNDRLYNYVLDIFDNNKFKITDN